VNQNSICGLKLKLHNSRRPFDCRTAQLLLVGKAVNQHV